MMCQVEVIFERDEEALDQALDQVLDDYGDPIILEHGPVDGLEVILVPKCHGSYSFRNLISIVANAHTHTQQKMQSCIGMYSCSHRPAGTIVACLLHARHLTLVSH